MILADLHTHTSCSHGTDLPAKLLDYGKKASLRHMAISEHSPLPPGFHCHLYNDKFPESFPSLIRELSDLKKRSPLLLIGMELDWTPANYNYMRQLVESAPFDHVLGSLHFLDGKSVGNPASWPVGMDQEVCFERFQAYYHEMASMCSSGLINIASHPDFIKLRVFDDFHKWLNTAAAGQAIAHAMEAMASNHVALEINTAGLRWPFGEFYPARKILAIARECGVEISFGSDAHKAEDVGAGFAEAEKYARSCGYDHYIVFFERRPKAFSF